MVQYEDTAADESVRIYDRGLDVKQPENFGEYRMTYRSGDMVAPRIEAHEPLALELEDFARCDHHRRRAALQRPLRARDRASARGGGGLAPQPWSTDRPRGRPRPPPVEPPVPRRRPTEMGMGTGDRPNEWKRCVLALAEPARRPAPTRPDRDASPSEDRLRVCMVHFSRFELDSRVQRQARSLASLGHEVHCVCLDGPSRIPVGDGAIRTYSVGRVKPREGTFNYIKAYGTLLRARSATCDRAAPAPSTWIWWRFTTCRTSSPSRR